MKKISKLLMLLLVAVITLSVTGCGVKTEKIDANSKDGNIVILHTNDVHGAIAGYSYLPGLKASYENNGDTVILVDAGDYTNGNIYVSISKGESAITLMNQVEYDIVTLGNHELDFGFDQLKQNLGKGNFNVLCSNLLENDKPVFDSEMIYQVGGVKIGFFALLTPETQTKVNPANIQGLKFTEKEELYSIAQKEADKLNKSCDVVICIAHLGVDNESVGNRSTDLYSKVKGIDFIIDGHSHTVMEKGENNEPIQSTGTEFANVGEIVISQKTKKIVSNRLVATEGLAQDNLVLATANNIIATVDEEFGATFAKAEVYFDGVKANVRSKETNLGDLIADSMIWSVTNETELQVDAKHVVAVTNGGGIRAEIQEGDVSRSTIKTVLPFGNTIAVNYVTGRELLEALEASTYCTPEAVGGFPQIGGMKIKIDTTKTFDAGEEYPDSTYCSPKSINRVSILEVNGEAFDENATYAVVTNNFCAAGGDTYYAFKRSYDAGNGFDTSIPMDEALVNYIQAKLGSKLTADCITYTNRITIE